MEATTTADAAKRKIEDAEAEVGSPASKRQKGEPVSNGEVPLPRADIYP